MVRLSVPFLHKISTAATGRSSCLDTVHISNSLDQPLWSGILSGRSESIHSEKMLNVSDLGWVTSRRYVSPGGRYCLLKECFTTVQKYILSSAFICLSVQHASCMQQSRWKESRWLKQYSWLHCLTPSVSTVRGNHSQTVPGEGRNVHKTDRERKRNKEA